MPNRPIALHATAVSVIYADGTTALRNVDLTVREGETLALIGESGSGKTTLLRLFNRLVVPTSGEVRVGDHRVDELDLVELRRATGYVPQDGGLMPHWTVDRNVGLVPRLRGWDEKRRRARVAEVLCGVGLDPERHGNRYPAELSGGQRQRVAFARALAAEPGVLLLDEPFGALDALTKLELQREFRSWTDDTACTVLLVTHDLAEAFRLADRVGVLRDGRLLQIDDPRTLRQTPAHPYVEALLSQLAPETHAP